ncbi:MAG: hypothetical protein RL419_1718 [Actinomycetota bacterium]
MMCEKVRRETTHLRQLPWGAIRNHQLVDNLKSVDIPKCRKPGSAIFSGHGPQIISQYFLSEYSWVNY